VIGCLACDISAGRTPVPGGLIAETRFWRADHCIGPFGVGAVVVKTKHHREALWALTEGESEEIGPFLRRVSEGIVEGLGAARAYVTMWVDKPPHHVHFVVYPRWPEDEFRGLDLQIARREDGPPPEAMAAAAAEVLRDFLA
jgi:diadenosine tetraphosphate (Ap4A) HIT family hydrolase